jgi:hypothetical protein
LEFRFDVGAGTWMAKNRQLHFEALTNNWSSAGRPLGSASGRDAPVRRRRARDRDWKILDPGAGPASWNLLRPLDAACRN